MVGRNGGKGAGGLCLVILKTEVETVAVEEDEGEEGEGCRSRHAFSRSHPW